MKSTPFEISPDLEKVIHSDFIKQQAELRESGSETDDGTKLLCRIILAECIAKSYGYSKMTRDAWEKSGTLELARNQRLQ
jgi:hypothetical protein